jgi:hypothetical protein
MTSAEPMNELVLEAQRLRPAPTIDVPGSLQALRRAALQARRLAQYTGTALIVVRSGALMRVREDIAVPPTLDR